MNADLSALKGQWKKVSNEEQAEFVYEKALIAGVNLSAGKNLFYVSNLRYDDETGTFTLADETINLKASIAAAEKLASSINETLNNKVAHSTVIDNDGAVVIDQSTLNALYSPS